MDNKGYKIYCYTNIINNKKYIGRTKTSLAARAGLNGKKYLKLRHFGAAIKKYGWDSFTPEILENNLTYEEACAKEKEYIKKFDTMNPNNGYNLAEGGEGPTKEALYKMKQSHNGKKLSKEHKQHISQGVGRGENNINYGRKHSVDFCLKQSQLKSGKNHPNWGQHLSDETKQNIREKVSRAVYQYDLNNNFIKEWESGKLAAKELNLNYTGINNCLRHIRHSSGGFIWRYKDKEKDELYSKNEYILNKYGINFL